MSTIHVIHENPEWNAGLLAALRERGLPVREWNLAEGLVDLSVPPPDGVFYSRLSASAHTRGHRHSPDFAAGLIAWLEGHGRKVINGGRVPALEMSKAAQYAALRAHGIQVPRTVVTLGRKAALQAAAGFDGPFIVKPNRGGKGLGVQLCEDAEALAALLDAPDREPPVDGILLLQEHIRAPQPFITRVEFVAGELLYAVQVDTTGGFELCPAEVCAVPGQGETFRILPAFDSPLVERYRRFLRGNGIAVAGIEFILDRDGRPFTYDVNTNTNYNPIAEAKAGVSGLAALAGHLEAELAQHRRRIEEMSAAG